MTLPSRLKVSGGISIGYAGKDYGYLPSLPHVPKCILVGDNLNRVKNTMAWGPQQRVDVFNTAAVVQEFFADREEFSDTASEVKLENLKIEHLMPQERDNEQLVEQLVERAMESLVFSCQEFEPLWEEWDRELHHEHRTIMDMASVLIPTGEFWNSRNKEIWRDRFSDPGIHDLQFPTENYTLHLSD